MIDLVTIRQLYPDLPGPDEYRQAQENLDAYLRLVRRIRQRIRTDEKTEFEHRSSVGF